MTNRVCTQCNIEKDILDFRHQIRDGKPRISFVCKKCLDIQRKKLRQSKKLPQKVAKDDNHKICKKCIKEKELSMFAKYRYNSVLLYKSTCRECNKPSHQKYYASKSTEIITKNSEYKKQNRTRVNEREKARKQSDIAYNLFSSVRSVVKASIRRNKGNKGGLSTLKYLRYSINELKEHLASQFETWMSWDNHGRYDSKTWNDNDPTTWTWQVDHIIPQSVLPYKSLVDDNFQKCWALSNLRPYSAKQNIIDGPSRIRHKGGK